MISCTEFIPAYSELFTFIEKKYGRGEVDEFWKYLFKPDGAGIPLINFVKKERIRGCFTYWTGTLNEEAADFTLLLNEKKGYFVLDMHKCPSKGRLLKLSDELGIVPYHDYCYHCMGYKQAVEKIGLEYHYDLTSCDRAACKIFIYDPKIFDGIFANDADTETLTKEASDNEYFHKDFHSSMNMGINYLGEKYGTETVVEYFNDYTDHVYQRTDFSEGLKKLEETVLSSYVKEKATDAVKTELKDDSLTVKVSYCPAVGQLIKRGSKVTPWFSYSTSAVMARLAEKAGVKFTMVSYDDATGACEYRFDK